MSSRRIALVGFLGALGVGLLGLLVASVLMRGEIKQTDGVLPVYPVAPLAAGDTVCQEPIGLADDLENVRYQVGTLGKLNGPEMDVTVTTPSGVVLGRGHVAPDWKDVGLPHTVNVGHVKADQEVSVCIHNRGPVRAYVYGDIPGGTFLGVRPTDSTSVARVDGQDIDGDITLWFTADKRFSLIQRIPAMFRHAAHFRPGFVGRGLYWALLAAMLLLVPFLLGRALHRSLR
jgi:hypothetical protein